MAGSQMKDTFLKHLQKLSAQCENLLGAEVIENTKYFELYERSRRTLNQLCPADQDFWEKGEAASRGNVERLFGKLRAAYLDLNEGILFLERQIQDQVAVDLMAQAEQLLADDTSDSHEHIPAAVLAGAVLEHFLRTLCGRQTPPIALSLDNGNLKTLATLVGDLEKIGLYNAAEKKQLKVWVGIRNSAAHGQFGEFTRKQVTAMIADIQQFIADHK